jgi:hypothetical protein
MLSNIFLLQMKSLYIYLGFFVFLGLTALSCNKAEQQPAYIQLQPFEVTEPGGNSLHALKESWVFLNGQFFGAFPTPCLIPILEEGNASLEIFPGVNENGFKLSPLVYLPMTTQSSTINLMPGQTTTIVPTTRYKSSITFPIGGSINFDEAIPQPFEDLDTDLATFFTALADTNSFSGKYGLMAIDTTHPNNVIGLAEKLEGLPTSGDRQIWLEMHYRNDVPFEFNLLGSSNSSTEETVYSVYYFNTKENWNKIYLNLTDIISLSKRDRYRLTLRTSLPRGTDGKYTQNNGFVAFDNVRLLHF